MFHFSCLSYPLNSHPVPSHSPSLPAFPLFCQAIFHIYIEGTSALVSDNICPSS